MTGWKTWTQRFGLALLLPVLAHSLFHLLDWLVWGLGGPSTWARELLSPFFQDATPLGLTMHAGVNVATLVLILVLWIGTRQPEGNLGGGVGCRGHR